MKRRQSIRKRRVSIGFSPCPNDTHIFCALVQGRIPLQRLTLAPEVLADVETLNGWALGCRLDITKISFHAMGYVLDKYRILDSGAALGRGCGPLLVAADEQEIANLEELRIAIPGRLTTAALLLKLYAPRCRNLISMPFDEIMPAVAGGRVDAGLIIHESRFTYGAHGLQQLVDLGAWWEEETGLPIPLGCIAASRALDKAEIAEIETAIRRSILHAGNYPDHCEEYIRRHAREMEIKVMRNHIDLYVNDFSLSLGEEGRAAVEELLRRGRDAAVFSEEL